MDVSQRLEQTTDNVGGEGGTKGKVTKSCGSQSKEKPGLSPIEEETDSSGDSAINFRGIELGAGAKNTPYDRRVSLRRDYEQVVGDAEEVREEEEEKQQPETPPFLTARNGSDHEAGSKSGDSNSTTSWERNTPDDDEDGDEDVEEDDEDEEDVEEDDEDGDEDSSCLRGESSSGNVDYHYPTDDERVRDPEEVDEDDLEEIEKNVNPRESWIKMKERRPKSARESVSIKSSNSNRDCKLAEIFAAVEMLKVRISKSERDVCCLRKQLDLEKLRSREFGERYEDERNIMKESLRIDLELWIKKLNDGLKGYLTDWQQRERLRLNEEISRISDLYSQEIAKSLKISLKEWQTEEAKKMFELMEKREKSRHDKEKANANAIYENIHKHLENLEKRNRKFYASFRKQIDKWEERLREEVVKIRDEDMKKLRQQVDMWREEERKKSLKKVSSQAETSVKKAKSKERCSEKRDCSFPGAEALVQVEENLLKRLRDSSSKDLRRTEQIVRTELKAQRRELAKRMNEKISELWMAFEEFGLAPSFGADRARPKRPACVLSAATGRNDLDECRGIGGSFMKDLMLNPDVHGGRRVAGKIVVRAPTRAADGSTRSGTEVEDGDRDFAEDDDDDESLMELGSEKSRQRGKQSFETMGDIGMGEETKNLGEMAEDGGNEGEGFSGEAGLRKG